MSGETLTEWMRNKHTNEMERGLLVVSANGARRASIFATVRSAADVVEWERTHK